MYENYNVFHRLFWFLYLLFIIYLFIYPAAMTSCSIVHKLFESLLQSFKSRIIYNIKVFKMAMGLFLLF